MINMRFTMVLLLLLSCLPAAIAEIDESQSVEATTALTLPVDSVTV